MSDINMCTFTGRVTADAVTKNVGTTTLVEFNIACNTGYGDRKFVSFIKVNAWGKQAAGIVQYLKKGKQVGVSGTFENRKWTGNDGLQHDSWTLTTAGSITLLADPKNSSSNTTDYGNPNDYSEEEPTF